MFCESCGAKIEEGQAFCESCGAAVHQPKPAPAPAPAPGPSVQTQQTPMPTVMPMMYYPQPVPAPEKKPVSVNGTSIPALIFSVVTLSFSWVPLLNVFTTSGFGFITVILSIIALTTKKAKGKSKAIVSLIILAVSVFVTIGIYIHYAPGKTLADPLMDFIYEVMRAIG